MHEQKEKKDAQIEKILNEYGKRGKDILSIIAKNKKRKNTNDKEKK